MAGRLIDLVRVVPDERRQPLWLYPHLLCLDAPLAAMAWLFVFGGIWQLGYHPWEAFATLGLGVWILDAANRLLSSVLLGGTSAQLELRHRFCLKHRRRWAWTLAIAVVVAVTLVVARMPVTLYKHLLLGSVLIAGFFGLTMLSSQESDELPFTRNILAGVTFAFGTAIMAHLYRGELGLYELLGAREFISYAVLCILQISAADLWEHSARSADLETMATDELTLTLPLILLGGSALAFAAMNEDTFSRAFFVAILTGAALLYILNRTRSRFSLEGLRAGAQIAMWPPVLVFWVLSRV